MSGSRSQRPLAGQVALSDLEVAAPGCTPGEHVEGAARDRAREVLAREAHVGTARPPAGREVVDLEGAERTVARVGAAGRIELRAASTPTASAARRVGRVGQPRPPVAPGVVAVQRGDLATQVAAARVPAQHVDVAPVRGRRGMVQRDRHRAHAPPAVAAQVVALDRRGAAATAPLEAAGHVDEPSHPRGCHLGACQQGGAHRGPAAGCGRGRLGVFPAVGVGEDDRRAASGHTEDDHRAHQPLAAHVCSAESSGAGSYPGHSTTGRRG